MTSTADTRAPHPIEKILEDRIVIIDGAMGTTIRTYGMTEADIRGDRFRQSKKDLLNNGDLFSLTQPTMICDIHRRFLEAGADIIETNSFNSTAISLADYGLESQAYALNLAASQVARRAVDAFNLKTPDRPRFVAGAIGPTNRTASLSPDVNSPAYRAVSFSQLVETYGEQIRGLIDGGVDLLLPETTFDTLNLKACLFAIEKLFE